MHIWTLLVSAGLYHGGWGPTETSTHRGNKLSQTSEVSNVMASSDASVDLNPPLYGAYNRNFDCSDVMGHLTLICTPLAKMGKIDIAYL